MHIETFEVQKKCECLRMELGECVKSLGKGFPGSYAVTVCNAGEQTCGWDLPIPVCLLLLYRHVDTLMSIIPVLRSAPEIEGIFGSPHPHGQFFTAHAKRVIVRDSWIHTGPLPNEETSLQPRVRMFSFI